jgi:hypothetical protein
MSRFARFARRLRQRALRCYELVMFALLLAVALAAAWPAVGAAALQCGKIHSSATVITT